MKILGVKNEYILNLEKQCGTRTHARRSGYQCAVRGRCTNDAQTSTGCDALTSADWLHFRCAQRCAFVAFARCALVAVASADGAMLLKDRDWRDFF